MSVELLELREAVEAAGPVREDGLVPLIVIRPGLGRGRGRHYYPRDMLREAVDQGRFKGWQMYVDHQAPEAKKAQGGLPRSMRDLGGVLKEVWWDDSVPAGGDHEQGAVMGLAKPTRFMRALVEDVPEAVGASISASATGVRTHTFRGQSANLVEGIEPTGSVDFVTKAGAGGRIASMIESLEEAEVEEDLLDVLGELPGLEVLEQLRSNPELAHQLLEMDAEDAKDGGDDELEEETKALMKKGMSRQMAAMAAKKKLRAMSQATHEGGDEVPTATEILTEALASEEGKGILREAVGGAFAEIVAPRLGELVEAALEDERELMQAELGAQSARRLELRDLSDRAHAKIAEAKLPKEFQAVLLEQYAIVDGKPTAKLDVIAEVEDGKVVKTAVALLDEQVEADVEAQRALVASVAPTTVRGQGATRTTTGEDGKPVEEALTQSEAMPATARLLESASLDPDEDLWEGLG